MLASSMVFGMISSGHSEQINNSSVERFKKNTERSSAVITNDDIKAYSNQKKNYPESTKKQNKPEPKPIKSLTQTINDRAKSQSAKNKEPLVKIDSNDNKLTITIKGDARQKISQPQSGTAALPKYLRIMDRHLPIEKWEAEYEEYFEAHYDDPSVFISKPALITVRSTKSPSLSSYLDICERGSLYDEGDDGPMYGHLSTHFAIDTNGMIVSTAPLERKTRGCEGLEYNAMTIELIGVTEDQFTLNMAQKDSLTDLLTELCEKYSIAPEKIYSQSEAAKGKKAAPEYLDLNDSEYPDSYSPRKRFFSPSKKYMDGVRFSVSGRIQAKKERLKNQKR